MTLVEVVILVGAQCLSPLESGPGLTVAGKVPCAVLIQHDPLTAAVEIVPPSAATDPALIAMLVKPRPAAIFASKMDRQIAVDDDITGSITPAPAARPRIVATSDGPRVKSTVTQQKSRTQKASVSRKKVVARRTDGCGSYRAVWYTNKDGRKKYRCVKSG